jgi:hypothetical protein
MPILQAFRLVVVVLGVPLANCALMLIPPMNTAVVELWQYRLLRQQCCMLKDATASQTCFER